jgi:hypothetical protein
MLRTVIPANVGDISIRVHLKAVIVYMSYLVFAVPRKGVFLDDFIAYRVYMKVVTVQSGTSHLETSI